jgi:hypothetical protein
VATVAGHQLPVHTQRSVEFAREREDAGGRKGDLELHLPFRGMSLSMLREEMLMLCSVLASLSTSSVSFCPGLPRRKVGEK